MAANSQQECIRKNVSRLEKVQMGVKAEELTAKLEGGITTAHTFTIDVVIAAKKLAIEVKAQHVLAKKYACRMERDALADKIAFGKKMGYKLETRLIIVDDATPDHIMAVYKKAGVGNFDVQSMEFVGSYDKYGKPLGIKFDKWGKRIGDLTPIEDAVAKADPLRVYRSGPPRETVGSWGTGYYYTPDVFNATGYSRMTGEKLTTYLADMEGVVDITKDSQKFLKSGKAKKISEAKKMASEKYPNASGYLYKPNSSDQELFLKSPTQVTQTDIREELDRLNELAKKKR